MIIIKMTSYTKSLLAIVIAMVATLFAFAWFHKKGKTLNLLDHEADELRSKFITTRELVTTVAKLESKLAEVNGELKSATNKNILGNKNQSSLMSVLLNTAVTAKVKVGNATETIKKNPITELKNVGIYANVSTCELTLSGSYAGIVEFLQQLATSGMFRINSLNITANETTEKTGIVTAKMVIQGFVAADSGMIK